MKKIDKKLLALLISVALLLTVVVSGTVAFLVDNTGSVVNTFTPTYVKVSVTDSIIEGGIKNNVVIKNESNIKAYIRAAVVANWCNDQGQIVMPWTGSITPNEGWTAGVDGYYYYKDPVVANTEVPVALFGSYTAPKEPRAGLHLEMDIIVQGIQAEGMGVNNAVDAFAKADKQ